MSPPPPRRPSGSAAPTAAPAGKAAHARALTGSSAVHRSMSSAKRGAMRSGLSDELPSPSSKRPRCRVDGGVELGGTWEFAPLHGDDHVGDVSSIRRFAGQDAVERCPQTVDVAADPRVQVFPRPARGSCTPAFPGAPRTVSADPLPELGTSGCSVLSRSGSGRSSDLARPQSTTSVSPCLPKITLLGLMSRCKIPRMGVFDGVANVGEAVQQLPQFERPATGIVL